MTMRSYGFARETLKGTSLVAIVAALVWSEGATAQSLPASPERGAALGMTPANAPADNQNSGNEVIVTATRLEVLGLDAPTPTAVLRTPELLAGNRMSIGQVLDDLPQFRGTTQPSTTVGNPNSGSDVVDLRGLNGNSNTPRTLVLLNGQRFIGASDLNNVPQDLIKRVDVVTGGASAAWGSGAIAGVVNIILDDSLTGGSLGVSSGISSRGDGAQYRIHAALGTNFAGGKGHLMVAGEYARDEGIGQRNSADRPNLDASLFTSSTGQLTLYRDVNSLTTTPGGVIRSGPLAGQSFNSDGSLSPVSTGSPSNATQTVGGTSRSTSDHYAVSQPYQRYTAFARASFDLSSAAHLWAQAGFTRMQANLSLFPETPTLTIQRDNAYLTPAQQAALGTTTSFTLGRILDDIGSQGFFGYYYRRDNIEGSVGINGSISGSWTYNAYYDHGAYIVDNKATDQRITANFNQALDAVINPATGQPVCRVALTNPSTTCQPLDLLGSGRASAAAIAYAFGDASYTVANKLDAGAISLHGNLFSTWAGTVPVALGIEARRESTATRNIDPISSVGGFAFSNFVPLKGEFNVKEAFGEIAVPLLSLPRLSLTANGAARYSDYSTSGGIWSWKYGGTAKIAGGLLLRAAYSRDIRAANISELFTTQSLGTATVVDPANNNATTPVLTYRGGNPHLLPEISHTLTLGGSASLAAIPGLQLSVDYFDIKIDRAIGTISGQDAVNQCFRGYAPACANVVRNSAGTVTTVYLTSTNLAFYKTRGVDLDLSWLLPLDRLGSKLPGSLRFRNFTTYTAEFQINDGVNIYDRAGDVGDSINFTTPKWRSTGSVGYVSKSVDLDFRLRYVGGGQFNHLLAITNNSVSSRTYFDIGAQFKSGPMTFFVNGNNVFDRDPPYVQYASAIYDEVGAYYSAGVRIKF